MKILHVTFSDHFGGANISAYRIHESLKQNNIDSKIPLTFNRTVRGFIDYFTIRNRAYTKKMLERILNQSLNTFEAFVKHS